MFQTREKMTRNCPVGNSSAQTLDMKGKALQIFSLIYILRRSHEAEQRCENNGWRTHNAEACLDVTALSHISESAQKATC